MIFPLQIESTFTFAVVDLIVVVENQKFFVVRCLQVCSFDDHFYSYEVRQTSKITLISCNSLMQDDCSCIRKVADRLLVTERIPLVHHIPGL
jgi:hypothetical protein